MLKGNYQEVPAQAPSLAGAQATTRWLISDKNGAPNFAMRVIEIKHKGEQIPLHRHGYEHEVFILSGQGSLLSPTGTTPISEGDFVLVLPDEEHGFENTGPDPLRFICVIPNQNG